MVMTLLKKTLLAISEILFPADQLTKKLEKMSAEEFVSSVKRLPPNREIRDVFVPYEYHDRLVNHAIHAVKFKGNALITKLLAQVLYENIIDELSEKIQFERFESPILVPIPSSKKRKQSRGWNQCELLADELLSIDRSRNFIVNKNILMKNKFTETQIGKTRAERLANLKDSFSVSTSESVIGKNIILLDDVVTTGATMNEAKKALKDSGARKVWCVAFAH